MAHLVKCIFGEAFTTDQKTAEGRVEILLLKSMTTVCVRMTALDIIIPHVDVRRYLISEATGVPYADVREEDIQRYEHYDLSHALMYIDLHSCGLSREDIADAQFSSFCIGTLRDIYTLLQSVERPKRKAALAFIKEHVYDIHNA